MIILLKLGIINLGGQESTVISGNYKYLRLQISAARRSPGLGERRFCFYIRESCSPASSALSVAPDAGRFLVLYLYGLANSPG